jgi:hypothetical protein
MAKILSFSPSKGRAKENLFRGIWRWFLSQDKFIKFHLLIFFLILTITPFAATSYIDTRIKASTIAEPYEEFQTIAQRKGSFPESIISVGADKKTLSLGISEEKFNLPIWGWIVALEGSLVLMGTSIFAFYKMFSRPLWA